VTRSRDGRYAAAWQVAEPGASIEGLDVLNTLTLPGGGTDAELVVGVSFNDGRSYATSDVWELRYRIGIRSTPTGARVTTLGPPTAWHQIARDGAPTWVPASGEVIEAAD
jgi:hypothetical protein